MQNLKKKKNKFWKKFAIKKWRKFRKPLTRPNCSVIVSKTLNNIFLTARTNKKPVLLKMSAGMSKLNSKRRLSAFGIERELKKFLIRKNVIKKFKEKKVRMVFHVAPTTAALKTIPRTIKEKGIFITQLKTKVRLSHNGIRKRKPKRR
jgi:ribosomal protein S11